MKRGLTVSAVIILLCFAGAAFAGVSVTANGRTTEAVAFPVGARAIGMGGAFVAVSDDATAPFWNPAGLSKVPHFQTSIELGADVPTVNINEDDIRTVGDALKGEASFSDLESVFNKFGSQTKTLRVGAGLSFAMHNLAISAISDAEGNVTFTQPLGSGTAIYADGNAVAFFGPAISAARAIKGNTAVGVTLRALQAKSYAAVGYGVNPDETQVAGGRAGQGDDRNIAFDIGVLTAPEEGLTVGAVLRNLNSPTFDLNVTEEVPPIPMSAKLDWSLDLGVAARERNVLLAWDIANIGRSGAVQVNMGLEYKPIKYLALRAGMMGGDYTLGAGLHLGIVGLDVASGERVKSMAALGLRTAW